MWERALLSLSNSVSPPSADTSTSRGCRPCYGVSNCCRLGWGDGVTCPHLLHSMCWVALPPWLFVYMIVRLESPGSPQCCFRFIPLDVAAMCLYSRAHLGCGSLPC